MEEGFGREKNRHTLGGFSWEHLNGEKGIDYINSAGTWEKLAESVGLKVVYSKKQLKPRGTMYMPILQEIANKKADLIFFVSSGLPILTLFAKQWADSAAKDIYVSVWWRCADACILVHDRW